MDQVSTLVSSTGQCHAVLISATRILAQCGTVVVPDTMKVTVFIVQWNLSVTDILGPRIFGYFAAM